MSSGPFQIAFVALVALAVCSRVGLAEGEGGGSSCVDCHTGIEDMHPIAFLSCVDCHGGDSSQRQKNLAHVHSLLPDKKDERVAALEEDLGWRRFKNPMDLRVVDRTCGECHSKLVEHLETSLHATTAGHLSDGFYEVGLLKERGSVYSIFNIPNWKNGGGRVESLTQVPEHRGRGSVDELSTHYSDLARKECMQCHLYSEGRAVRGRVGFDGDYRGEGCAACHVEYALDGLSESADSRVARTEPGHPRMHKMTRNPTTQTCTSCHYGDASIGLSFRGLSQLPPGAPGGPDVAGTTKALLNRQFYLNDAATCPPDIHHERGMHCVDCHTLEGVMGDGALEGAMEHQVEISCQACHGSFEAVSTLKTENGVLLKQLRRVGDNVILTSKVTGKEHSVAQVAHLIDPEHSDFNEAAQRAMTGAHADVECYTCHAGWNVNFLGFHFDRNESLSQLDLISGKRTPGRVTTQEKVFATWKSFYAGLNETGKVAPYMTGFSTMGSYTDSEGVRVLDQVMPVTAKGLSGLTMIHHQTHTVRPTARSCVECHRASATWGLGSPNFRLARQLAFVADRRGIEVIALNRTELAASIPLLKIVQPDIVAMTVLSDPLQGHAQYLFAAEGQRGVHVFDVRDPANPKRVGFVATINPLGMDLHGDTLYLADGVGGLRIFDVSNPEQIRLASVASMFEANAVSVQWPYAYVADGPGGLAICDVRVAAAPRFVSALAIGKNENVPDEITAVATLFQYSRPRTHRDGRPRATRTKARNVAAVLDRVAGLSLVDVTDPQHPFLLYPKGDRRSASRNAPLYTGLLLRSHVDLAESQGGESTRERDYAYVLLETGNANNRRTNVVSVDISDPKAPKVTGDVRAAAASEMAVLAEIYNPPFLQSVVLTAGESGVSATNVSVSKDLTQLGSMAGLRDCYVIALEEFPLDRMVDEQGAPLKDVSHEGSRWLRREEFTRILDVPEAIIRSLPKDLDPLRIPGRTARLHFDRLDANRNGLLQDAEFSAGGGRAVDLDKDGRITLLELAQATGALRLRFSAAPEEEPVSVFDVERIGENGDLARLLDRVKPVEFDSNGDARLASRELKAAFFAALDLSADGALSPVELSRAPGELRQLRYGGEWAVERFRKWDSNNDGSLSLREYKLDPSDVATLDRDENGFVQLDAGYDPRRIARGDVQLPVEWPARRRFNWNLPPNLTLERLLETLDKNEDGKLTRRELAARPDLRRVFDVDGDQAADELEIARVLDVLGRFGLDAVGDEFRLRWDLNGNGRVEEAELPAWTGSRRIALTPR